MFLIEAPAAEAQSETLREGHGGAGMWTEQAVETLRRLALEGRSAAWIAAALGAPSRNAVIGKANRIGVRLNGAPRSGPIDEPCSERPLRPEIPWGRRPAPNAEGPRSERPQPAEIPRRRTRQAPIGEGPRSERPRPAEIRWGRAASQARSRAPAISREKKRSDRWTFASAEIGEMRRIAFAEICEVQCRWPLGDPTQEDFAYCGLPVAKGHAYCAGHCRLAYRLPNEQGAKRA